MGSQDPFRGDNSKFEPRNSKFEKNPNVQNRKFKSLFGEFEHWDFVFVSDFDILISDLTERGLQNGK